MKPTPNIKSLAAFIFHTGIPKNPDHCNGVYSIWDQLKVEIWQLVSIQEKNIIFWLSKQFQYDFFIKTSFTQDWSIYSVAVLVWDRFWEENNRYICLDKKKLVLKLEEFVFINICCFYKYSFLLTEENFIELISLPCLYAMSYIGFIEHFHFGGAPFFLNPYECCKGCSSALNSSNGLCLIKRKDK